MRIEMIAVILGMAIITFLTRFLFMALFSRTGISEKTIAVMRFVPIAVLMSLIAPALFAPRGRLDLSFTNEYLVAGILATALTYRTRNLILAIIVGVSTILLMRFLFA